MGQLLAQVMVVLCNIAWSSMYVEEDSAEMSFKAQAWLCPPIVLRSTGTDSLLAALFWVLPFTDDRSSMFSFFVKRLTSVSYLYLPMVRARIFVLPNMCFSS